MSLQDPSQARQGLRGSRGTCLQWSSWIREEFLLYRHRSWDRDQQGLKSSASHPPPGAASQEQGLVTAPRIVPGFAGSAERGRNVLRENLQAGSHLGEAQHSERGRRQTFGSNHLSQERTSDLSPAGKVTAQSPDATLCSARCHWGHSSC